MGLVETVIERFCASLALAKSYELPFAYFRLEKLFPDGVAASLAALPLPASPPADGRRESVKDRIYLADKWLDRDGGLLRAVATALQSEKVTAAIASRCGAALNGTYLRLEYAIDADGFWLEPHTDLGVKKLTGLIGLSGGDDLGTDLYRSPAEPFGRVVFEPNAGTLFVPGPTTWHGFARRPMKELRKSLILNYVGPEWQSRDQLAFPDRPISV